MKKRSIFLFACVLGLAGAGHANDANLRPTPTLAAVAPPLLQLRARTPAPDAATPVLRRVAGRRALPGPDNACDPSGLCLAVTVGTDLDPGSCGTVASLDVAVGDRVNFCYTVTNDSDTPFYLQSLADNDGDPDRPFFTALPATIEPHSTYQYNRIERMRENWSANATWTALHLPTDYIYDDTAPFEFVDATDGEDLRIAWSGETPVFAPFPLHLYGMTSRRLAVRDGTIGFGWGHTSQYGAWPFPLTSFGAMGVTPILNPFGMAFSGASGAVFTKTLGAAPNRRFVVEWYERDGMTYEVVFEEGSQKILFAYLDTQSGDPAVDDGAAAAVGLNFGGPDNYLEATYSTTYSYQQPLLHDGLAIRWTPASAAVTSTSTAWASVQVHTSGIGMDTAPIHASVPPGGSATSTLTIDAIGGGTLRYDIGPPVTSLSGGAVPAVGILVGIDEQHGSGYVRAARIDAAAPQTIIALSATGIDEPLLSSQLGFAGDDLTNVYAITQSELIRYDTTTGVAVPVGPTGIGPSGHGMLNLAYSAPDGKLYTVVTWVVDLRGVYQLYSVDPQTGAATPGRFLDLTYDWQLKAIAIDSTGEMFGVNVNAELLRIDPLSGDVRKIGDTGILQWGGCNACWLGVDRRDDSLYLVNMRATDYRTPVYVVDRDTGAATELGLIGDSVAGWPATQWLGFAIATTAPFDRSCSDLADVPWLTVDAPSGEISWPPRVEVNLAFDAGDLPDGDYTANLCVNSNDPQRPHLRVPVTLSVGEGSGKIFADGFDGAAP